MKAINNYPNLYIESENLEEEKALLDISMASFSPRSAGITQKGERRLHLLPSELQAFCDGLTKSNVDLRFQFAVVNALADMIQTKRIQ